MVGILHMRLDYSYKRVNRHEPNQMHGHACYKSMINKLYEWEGQRMGAAPVNQDSGYW